MNATTGKPFGLAGYITGTTKTGTIPLTFGLATYTAAKPTDRIPTIWTSKKGGK